MFMRMTGVVLAVFFAVLTVGCSSLGGSQTQTTIYDMHRRIVKLDKDLGDSITKLNETSASLNARVEEMDQQTRSLNSQLEDATTKLNELNKEFAAFKSAYYRINGLNPGTVSGAPLSGTLPGASAGPVSVDRPAGAAPAPLETPSNTMTGTNELVDSAPVTVGTTPPAAGPDAATLYQQAQRSYSANDYAASLKQFDEYLSKYPNSDSSSNAQFWKAKCLLSMEKYAEAIKAFEEMRSKYANSSKVPFAMHNQAVAHSRLGQTAEAERLMKAVIDQYPTSPVAEQAKADLRRLQGQ